MKTRTGAIDTAHWVRSSYSGTNGGECVEWRPGAVATGVVPVRDSKRPDGPVLRVSPAAWASLAAAAKTGTW